MDGPIPNHFGRLQCMPFLLPRPQELAINFFSLSPKLVFRFEQYNVSELGENCVCHFYDICADSIAQHVDCYDGKYVRARH